MLNNTHLTSSEKYVQQIDDLLRTLVVFFLQFCFGTTQAMPITLYLCMYMLGRSMFQTRTHFLLEAKTLYMYLTFRHIPKLNMRKTQLDNRLKSVYYELNTH